MNLVIEDTTLILCTKCGESKNSTDFYRNKSRKSGYDCWCKSCKSTYKRERNYLSKLVGTPERKDLRNGWIERQWKLQKGKCFWTGKPMVIGDPLRRPSLDRLIPGADYSPENTVLTQYAINIMRLNNSQASFLNYLIDLGIANTSLLNNLLKVDHVQRKTTRSRHKQNRTNWTVRHSR